jgi:hypothetical protein
MRISKVHGVIRRRLLVNFRVDPAAITRNVPAPFRPKLHDGWAVAGVCLIRLDEIRPKGFPRLAGISSENAAHRVAVVWEDESGPREGVYIPRRDTGSLINHVAGGRVFPGEHQRATFQVSDTEDRIALTMASADGTTRVEVVARPADSLPATSIFRSLDAASTFFEPGSLGFSTTCDGNRLDGVRLTTSSWQVGALDVERVHSSYFADPDRFPPGSVTFDCALIMRDVRHEWQEAAAP